MSRFERNRRAQRYWDMQAQAQGLLVRKDKGNGFYDFPRGVNQLHAKMVYWSPRLGWKALTRRSHSAQTHKMDWDSPWFADPKTAVVYAKLCNWGQE